jgi:hypothetical protein
MKVDTLSRERLKCILSRLDQYGGAASLRNLMRSHGIRNSEVEECEALGWLVIETRKPWVGRPSRFARRLNETQSAKLPPPAAKIPQLVSHRHWCFALESVSVVRTSGRFGFDLSTAVRAYQKVYPEAKTYASACAGASRLMKRTDVRLMRLWFRRVRSGREPMPQTVRGLYTRLRQLGHLT